MPFQSTLSATIKEQLARVMQGQLDPGNLTEAVSNAFLNQKQQEALFFAGQADRPGRNWDLMQRTLAEQEREKPIGFGGVTRAAGRDLEHLVKGMGQLLWRTATSPLRPVETAKFITGDLGRLLQPGAWKEAWKRTTAPGEYERPTGEAPKTLAETAQDVIAQTGRGYLELAKDPVGRFKREPLFTALDVLPVWGGGARVAGGIAAKLPGPLASRVASAASKAGPLAALKSGGKFLADLTPTTRRLSQAASDMLKYQKIKTINDWEKYYGSLGDQARIRKTLGPWEEKFKENPGLLRAIVENRASPIGLGAQESRDLTATLLRRGRMIERKSTRPIQKELGKEAGTEFRAYKPVIDILTDTFRGKRGEAWKSADEATLVGEAKKFASASPVDELEVRNLGRQLEAQGIKAKYEPKAGTGKPTVKGDTVLYEPLPPTYASYFAEYQGDVGHYFMMPTPRAQRGFAKPFLQRHKGGQDIPMMQNLAEIDTLHLAQVRKAVHNEQMINDVMSQFQRELALPNGERLATVTRHQMMDPQILELMEKQGLAGFSPDSHLRMFREEVNVEKTLLKELKAKGASETDLGRITKTLAKYFSPEEINGMVQRMGVTTNDKMYLLPKQVVAGLKKRVSAKDWKVKVFVDKALDIWRPIVLCTPRWIVNNVVGNVMLNTLRGVGPASYARALKSFWEDWKQAHGMRVNQAWLDLVPEEVKRGFVGAEETMRHLNIRGKGEFADALAGLGDAAEKSALYRATVTPAGKLFSAVRWTNMQIEDVSRRANYFRGAWPEARKALMQRAVVKNLASEELMGELKQLSREASHFDPLVSGIKDGRDLMQTTVGQALVGKVNEFLFDYMQMNDWERRYMRTLVPFWSWYRNIVPLMAGLPATHPLRARLAEMAASAGGDMAREMDAENIPDYMRSSVEGESFQGMDPISGEPAEMTRFWHTRGMNPLATIGEAAAWPNVMNPFLRAIMETAGSKDLLTGRPLEREGLTRDILTGDYLRIGPHGEFEKASKHGGPRMLMSRLAEQVPWIKAALEAISGGKRRYGDRLLATVPGSVKDRNLGRSAMRLSGFPYTDVSQERMKESLEEERKRTTTRLWNTQLEKNPTKLRDLARRVNRRLVEVR